LLDSISTPAFAKVQMHCRDTGLQEFHTLGVITGCMGRLADTVYSAYRERDSVSLAITKRFFVERPRLSAVGDSLRAKLSQEFGPALHCIKTVQTPDTWDSWQWHVGPTTIQLAIDSQMPPPKLNHREYPWIGVQFAEAVLSCDDWLPEAHPVD